MLFQLLVGSTDNGYSGTVGHKYRIQALLLLRRIARIASPLCQYKCLGAASPPHAQKVASSQSG